MRLYESPSAQVLACPAPTIDLTMLQGVMEILRADIYTILDMRELEPKTTSIKLVEDIVFASLFTAPTAPPPVPRECAKMHHSSRTIEGDEEHAR